MTPGTLLSPRLDGELAGPQLLSLDWTHQDELDFETSSFKTSAQQTLWTKTGVMPAGGSLSPERESRGQRWTA